MDTIHELLRRQLCAADNVAAEYLAKRPRRKKTERVAVDAEAKFVLLKCLRVIGRGASLGGTQQQFARVLAVPERAALRSIARLVETGCLTRTETWGPDHKVAVSHRVVPDVLAQWKIESLAQVEGAWRDQVTALIEHLLMAPFEVRRAPGTRRQPPSRTGAGEGLNVTNRLVLMTLLAAADVQGVVSNVSPAVLAETVGLNGTRLHAHLEKLLRLGFIRAVVPGVSGESLFGVAPGSYFLNLRHPFYGATAIPGITFLFPADAFNVRHELAPHLENRRYREAHQLFGWAKGFVRSGGNGGRDHPFREYVKARVDAHDQSILALAEIFSGGGSPGIPDYLQLKIETYASNILSSHWEDIQVDPDDVEGDMFGQRRPKLRCGEWLLKRISQDVVPRKVRANIESNPMAAYELLVKLTYQMSVSLAAQLKRALDGISRPDGKPMGLDMRKMNYVIVPSIKTNAGAQFVLDATYKVKPEKPRLAILLLRSNYKGFVYTGKKILETDYTQEEKYLLGLLTRPIGKQ